jgi:hypothetical protein
MAIRFGRISALQSSASNRQGSYARFELLSILAAGVRKGDRTLRSLNPRELRTSRKTFRLAASLWPVKLTLCNRTVPDRKAEVSDCGLLPPLNLEEFGVGVVEGPVQD